MNLTKTYQYYRRVKMPSPSDLKGYPPIKPRYIRTFDQAVKFGLVSQPQEYKKIPVTIRAARITESVIINTLEGEMKAGLGHWLIEGIEGEVYACAADIFARTYEKTGD